MLSSSVRGTLTHLILGSAISFAGVGVAQSPEILYPQQMKGVTPPSLVTSVEPTYPNPRDKNEKLHAGMTRVYLVVDAKGIPKDLRVDQSSGFDDLDQAALAAVRQYRFQPATKDGMPLSVPLRVVVNFKSTAPGDRHSLEPVSVQDDPESPLPGFAATPDVTANGNPSDVPNFSVGGPVTPPVLIKSALPKYSDSGRIEGQAHAVTAKVYAILDERGLPTRATVATSCGFPELDQAAVDAVEKYRFKPATRDGQPVKVYIYISINFQMR